MEINIKVTVAKAVLFLHHLWKKWRIAQEKIQQANKAKNTQLNHQVNGIYVKRKKKKRQFKQLHGSGKGQYLRSMS